MTSGDPRRELVEANRILAGEGLLDAFGHVSARSPDRADRFLLSRAMAPALVTVADVFQHDCDGVATPEGTGPLFLERFIHAEIYRTRPDVGAVVHSHSLAVLPFTVTRPAMRPIFHMCGHLQGAPPPFDIADHAGPGSDLLVRNSSLGAALATHLGGAAVVLMRGHGFTVVGADVAQATFRAIYTARNCEVQQAAMRLGDPHYLSEGEALACAASTSGQITRAWDLWRRTYSGSLSEEQL